MSFQNPENASSVVVEAYVKEGHLFYRCAAYTPAGFPVTESVSFPVDRLGEESRQAVLREFRQITGIKASEHGHTVGLGAPPAFSPYRHGVERT